MGTVPCCSRRSSLRVTKAALSGTRCIAVVSANAGVARGVLNMLMG